jgi:hypothetical protein
MGTVLIRKTSFQSNCETRIFINATAWIAHQKSSSDFKINYWSCNVYARRINTPGLLF